jgi:hypothetical protein
MATMFGGIARGAGRASVPAPAVALAPRTTYDTDLARSDDTPALATATAKPAPVLARIRLSTICPLGAGAATND